MATLDAADGEAAAKRQRVGGWAENCLNQGCRSVQCFRKLNRIWGAAVGSGRYDFPSFFHRLKKTISGWTIISHRFHFQLLAPPKKNRNKNTEENRHRPRHRRRHLWGGLPRLRDRHRRGGGAEAVEAGRREVGGGLSSAWAAWAGIGLKNRPYV